MYIGNSVFNTILYSISACKLRHTIYGTRGVIVSPNYPNSYEGNLSCVWTIKVPKGLRLKLSFTAFQLEGHEQHCHYDWVEIWDDFHSGTLDKFCGTTLPPAIYTNSGSIKIKFRTDAYGEQSGFRAVFATEPINSQGNVFKKI